mgnify:FL=1
MRKNLNSEKTRSKISVKRWENIVHSPAFSLIVTILSLLLVYYLAQRVGLIDSMQHPELLISLIRNQGVLGVFSIIALMSIAIVLNPIPSAPIAVVSGAVYGHAWGTVYIVLGALLGAVIAFGISRFAGRKLVYRMFSSQKLPKWTGSQTTMMMIVLLSRLIPFISFDLVSYGAGLTSLQLWRFCLATFIGLLPASFILAHFGSVMSNENITGALSMTLVIGLLVVLPILYGLYKKIKTEILQRTNSKNIKELVK